MLAPFINSSPLYTLSLSGHCRACIHEFVEGIGAAGTGLKHMRNKFNLHLHAGEERVGTTLCWGRGRRNRGMGEGEGEEGSKSCIADIVVEEKKVQHQ